MYEHPFSQYTSNLRQITPPPSTQFYDTVNDLYFSRIVTYILKATYVSERFDKMNKSQGKAFKIPKRI